MRLLFELSILIIVLGMILVCNDCYAETNHLTIGGMKKGLLLHGEPAAIISGIIVGYEMALEAQGIVCRPTSDTIGDVIASISNELFTTKIYDKADAAIELPYIINRAYGCVRS